MNRCSKDIESGGHVRALRMLYSDKSLSVTLESIRSQILLINIVAIFSGALSMSIAFAS